MMTFPKWMCLQTMQFCKQTDGRCPELGWKSWEIWVCLELRTSLTCQLASCWRPFFQSSSLGEASSIADVTGTLAQTGFARGCYSLPLQAFTKVAASTSEGADCRGENAMPEDEGLAGRSHTGTNLGHMGLPWQLPTGQVGGQLSHWASRGVTTARPSGQWVILMLLA